MKKYIRYLIPLLSVLLLGVVVVYGLYAQKAPQGLVVHPSNFDLTYHNQPVTQTVTLDNRTDSPQTIAVDVRNFTANGEEGSVALTTQDTSFSLAKWVKVTPSQVTIPARQSKDFTFTITPPANAEPGGHFGSIVFATVPGKTPSGTAGSALSQEVASLILFEIPGNAVEKASLENLTTDKSFYEFGPVTFIARVKNSGAVHIAPMGQLVVKGTFGDKYVVNLTPDNVLPNAVRRISAILPNKLLAGHYVAHLVAAYGSKNEQLNGYVEFNAFPVRYAAIVLAVLIVLFLLRKRLFRAFKTIITGK